MIRPCIKARHLGLILILLQVQSIPAQVTEPTLGEMMASNIGDAIDAAQNARTHMIEFNIEIAAARQRYRQCAGTCAEKDEIGAELDSMLTSKDFHYSMMGFLGEGLKGLGALTHFNLTQMILGDVDGGMPPYAAATFRMWTKCLEDGKQMGLFIDFPSLSAYETCQEIYAAHRERRNLWEFIQRPGVLESLLAEGARPRGVPLLEQQRNTLDKGDLPGNIANQEILTCVYGPIGSAADAVTIKFQYWYGRMPLTRADLLREMKGGTDPRRVFLQIPESPRTQCPTGDLNALAIVMSQTDSREFLEVQEQKSLEQRRRDYEEQRAFAIENTRRIENDKIHKQLVLLSSREVAATHNKDMAECNSKMQTFTAQQIKDCRRSSARKYRLALDDVKISTFNSLQIKNFSTTTNMIATHQGKMDACLGNSDTVIRARMEELAIRGFPENAKLMDLERRFRAKREVWIMNDSGGVTGKGPDLTPVLPTSTRLMEEYDFTYEGAFLKTLEIQENIGEPFACKESSIESARSSIEGTMRLTEKQVDGLVRRRQG